MRDGTSVAIDFDVSLRALQCGGCSMVFAIPDTLYQQYRQGKAVRCPSKDCPWGGMVIRKTTEQQLKEELESLRAEKDAATRSRRWAERNLELERRSHSATKGHLTRAKKRVANGVCPCCNRSFENLRRHMKAKHPDWEGKI